MHIFINHGRNELHLHSKPRWWQIPRENTERRGGTESAMLLLNNRLLISVMEGSGTRALLAVFFFLR